MSTPHEVAPGADEPCYPIADWDARYERTHSGISRTMELPSMSPDRVREMLADVKRAMASYEAGRYADWTASHTAMRTSTRPWASTIMIDTTDARELVRATAADIRASFPRWTVEVARVSIFDDYFIGIACCRM
jgi:hypothetical protein